MTGEVSRRAPVGEAAVATELDDSSRRGAAKGAGEPVADARASPEGGRGDTAAQTNAREASATDQLEFDYDDDDDDQGPSRLAEFNRWREIVYMLVLRDLKARTKQAYLGYFWIVVQPLLLTGVFSFLVQQVLGRTDVSAVPYPVFLMAGVIPWQFFANTLNECSESLVKNVDLVRQVYFPRELLATYPVFSRLIDVVVGCVALAVFMVVFHVPFSGWAVLLPVIVAEEMLFAAALGMLLSAANVAWRDVARGLPLVLYLMLYAVPVLYPPERVPAALQPYFDLNPIAQLINAFRSAALGPQPPDAVLLVVLGALGLVSLFVAQRLFAVFDGVLADVI
jgi:lipopolysaccharide transport system permease protein